MIAIMLNPVSTHLKSLSAEIRNFAAGQNLFYQQDPVRGLYWVLAGEIHLHRHDAHGRSIILQRAGKGSLLAEASLFSPTYHCDAVAITATRTRRFAILDIHRRLNTDPAFAVAWATHLAGEVQNARYRAEILSMARVRDRLDGWIAWNGGRLPERGEGTYIAAEIGVSPEALYRELASRRKAAREAQISRSSTNSACS